MVKLRVIPLLLLLGTVGRADELTEKGRAIFNRWHKAVVTVQMVITSRISSGLNSQTNESHQTVSGTVVDASGLAVVCLAAIDAEEMMQNMPPRDPRLKFELEVSSIRMLLENGSEVAATVVGRDRDLGIAFIRPTSKPATPLTAIDLAQAGTAEVLDQVIALNRLGNAASRAYSASAERIAAVAQQPRLFYIPDSNMTTATLGAPAFTLEGKVLGVFVIRSVRGKNALTMSSTQGENLTGIIVPAKDILAASRQVSAK